MLKLIDILKDYPTATTTVHALRGVSLNFREHEFVAILGPSGCGKTTMLNIIGGLDRYTQGDLVLGGVSTATFDDLHWDAYRNATIGFVFQSYNLIPHLTVLENVELALSLSGEKKKIRREKAVSALHKVGMSAEINKRPNQLSGGQMQRVAIARAIVNDPKIILADEPTGALDSELSVQVMDILRQISEKRLVIMVTHNAELAQTYCSRICRFKDGMLIEDTDPYEECEPEQRDETSVATNQIDALATQNATINPSIVDNRPNIADDAAISEAPSNKIDVAQAASDNDDDKAEEDGLHKAKNKRVSNRKRKKEMQKLDVKTQDLFDKLGLNSLQKRKRAEKAKGFKPTSMSLGMAVGLSVRNLISKRRRTFFTSFAGSIGIIGLGLVLAISNGFSVYVDRMQTEMLAGVPVGVYEYNVEITAIQDMLTSFGTAALPENAFPNNEKVIIGKDETSGGLGGVGDMVGELISSFFSNVTINQLSEDFAQYMLRLPKEDYGALCMFYGTRFNLLRKSYNDAGEEIYLDVSKSPAVTSALSIATTVLGSGGIQNTYWQMLTGGKENILSSYDLLKGNFPTSKNELVLCLDECNGVSQTLLDKFGIALYQHSTQDPDSAPIIGADGHPVAIADDEVDFEDFIGRTFVLASNDDYYIKPADGEYYDAGLFTPMEGNDNDNIGIYVDDANSHHAQDIYQNLCSNEDNVLKIVGVIRPKKGAKTKYVNGGSICYLPELAENVLESSYNSDIAAKQRQLLAENTGFNAFGRVLTDKILDENSNIMSGILSTLDLTSFNKAIGAVKVPSYISVYPTTYAQKLAIGDYISKWNDSHPRTDNIKNKPAIGYFDVSEMFIYNINMILDLVSAMLVAVASISLVVSTVMIGVITSNSVIERTREIGILRSLGARKRDIRHVFLAETSLIGLASGLIGIVVTYILSPIISVIIKATVGVSGLLHFHPLHALLLVILSFCLTVVSGIIPAINASRKNVVDALRLE